MKAVIEREHQSIAASEGLDSPRNRPKRLGLPLTDRDWMGLVNSMRNKRLILGRLKQNALNPLVKNLCDGQRVLLDLWRKRQDRTLAQGFPHLQIRPHDLIDLLWSKSIASSPDLRSRASGL